MQARTKPWSSYARGRRGTLTLNIPRGIPLSRYNGKVERKFATLWARVQSDLNAAKFPKRMRHGLVSK